MKLSLDEHIGPVLAIAVVEVVAAGVSFMYLPGVVWLLLAPIPFLLGHLPGLAKCAPALLLLQFLVYPFVFGLGLAGNVRWRKAAVILLLAHVAATVTSFILVLGFHATL
jgi:hypothetical protein